MQLYSPKRAKFLLILLTATGMMAVGSVAVAYSWFKQQAIAEMNKRELAPYMMNGLKHAYAAAETYQLFSQVLPPEWSAEAVMTLGYINEYVEFAYRSPSKRDASEEIRKDLANNIIGIEAARWREEEGDENDLITIIGYLTEQAIIRNTETRYDASQDEEGWGRVTNAIIWSQEQQQSLSDQTYDALDAAE